VWAWGRGGHWDQSSVERAFEAKNPNIDLEPDRKMGGWDLMDKLYARWPAGDGAPERQARSWVRGDGVSRNMASRGRMVDLTDRIAKYKTMSCPTAWMQAEFAGKIWGGMPDVLPGWVMYNRES